MASKRVAEILTAAFFCWSSPLTGTLPALPILSREELATYETTFRDSIQQAYRRLESNPDDAQANGHLGMIFEAYEQYELASTCYQRAGLLDARSFQWAYYLARIQSALGNDAQAAAAWGKAVALKPGYLPALLKLADSLLGRGEWEESRTIYERVLEQDPQSPLGYYGMGRVQAATGELPEAVKSFQKAFQLSPAFGAAHYALAMAYRDLGDQSRSSRQLQLFQRNPEARPPLDEPSRQAVDDLKPKARSHFTRGVWLKKNGRLLQAAEVFEQALQIEPSAAAVHAALLSTYLDLGRLTDAEPHYRAAVKLDGGLYEAHHNWGVLLTLEGKPEEAAEVFRQALSINPFYAESHANLAFILSDQGRRPEALTHFRLALENKPNLRFAHFGLGKILQEEGKHEEAIRHFLRTLTVEDEKTSLFLYNLADAYANAGQVAKALDSAQKARARAERLGQTMVLADIDKLLEDLQDKGNPK